MPRTPYYGGEYEYYSPEEEDEDLETFEEVTEEQPESGDILAHQPEPVETFQEADQTQKLRDEYLQLQQEQEQKAEQKDLKRKIKRLKHPGFFESAEKMKDTGKKLAAVGTGFVSGMKEYVTRSQGERHGKRIAANQKLQKIKEKTQMISGGMGNKGTLMLTQSNQGKPNLDLVSGGSNLDLLGGSGSGLSLTSNSSKKKTGIQFTGGSGSGLSLTGGSGKGISLFDESNRSGLLSFNINGKKRSKKKKTKRRKKR